MARAYPSTLLVGLCSIAPAGSGRSAPRSPACALERRLVLHSSGALDLGRPDDGWLGPHRCHFAARATGDGTVFLIDTEALVPAEASILTRRWAHEGVGAVDRSDEDDPWRAAANDARPAEPWPERWVSLTRCPPVADDLVASETAFCPFDRTASVLGPHARGPIEPAGSTPCDALGEMNTFESTTGDKAKVVGRSATPDPPFLRGDVLDYSPP